MTEFLTIVGATFIGYVLATVFLCAIALNKGVNAFIAKILLRNTKDVMEIMEDEFEVNDKIES